MSCFFEFKLEKEVKQQMEERKEGGFLERFFSPSQQKKDERCKYFDAGYCRKGDACAFIHDGPGNHSQGDDHLESSSSSDDDEDSQQREGGSDNTPKKGRGRGGRVDVPKAAGGWGGGRGKGDNSSKGGKRRNDSPREKNKGNNNNNNNKRRKGVRVTPRLLSCDHTPRYMKIPAFAKKSDDQDKLTIVVLSDTHSLHTAITPLPQGPRHILIHCGDFTHMGAYEDAVEFNEWLGEQKYDHKFIISGNHERLCGDVREHHKVPFLPPLLPPPPPLRVETNIV